MFKLLRLVRICKHLNRKRSSKAGYNFDFYPAVTSRRLSLAGTAWPIDLAEQADQKSSPGLHHNRVPTETPDLQLSQLLER